MGVLLPWFLAAGLQTYRDVKNEGRPPVPSEFVASGALFAGLAVLGQANAKIAAMLAWGFLIAIAVQAGPQALVGAKSLPPPTDLNKPGGKGRRQ